MVICSRKREHITLSWPPCTGCLCLLELILKFLRLFLNPFTILPHLPSLHFLIPAHSVSVSGQLTKIQQEAQKRLGFFYRAQSPLQVERPLHCLLLKLVLKHFFLFFFSFFSFCFSYLSFFKCVFYLNLLYFYYLVPMYSYRCLFLSVSTVKINYKNRKFSGNQQKKNPLYNYRSSIFFIILKSGDNV